MEEITPNHKALDTSREIDPSLITQIEICKALAKKLNLPDNMTALFETKAIVPVDQIKKVYHELLFNVINILCDRLDDLERKKRS